MATAGAAAAAQLEVQLELQLELQLEGKSAANPAAPVQHVPFSAGLPKARLDPHHLDPHHRDAQPDLDAPGGSEIETEPAPASP